jgi:Tol biopolymer transport system component
MSPGNLSPAPRVGFRRPVRSPAWAAPLLGIVVALAACSSGGSGATEGSGSPAASEPTGQAGTSASPETITVQPGEEWILYQDEQPKTSLVRPDGSGSHSPTSGLPGGDEKNPDWSPDGQRIALIVADDDGTEDLWVVDVDGADAERILDCADPCRNVDDPSWMPDGQSIIYSRNAYDPSGAVGLGTLEVVQVATGDVEVLLGPESTVAFAGVRPAPDGSAAVLEVVSKTGPDPWAEATGLTLSVVDLSTAAHAVTAITDPALFAATADWSPDGTLIIYSALAQAEDESPDLFSIRPDGTEMTQVTQLAADGGSAIHPTFTPDSARVVFVADLGTGDGGLAQVDLNGANLGPATSDGYLAGNHPRIRPTG